RSKDFPPFPCSRTSLHFGAWLGHAILHPTSGLHRDRAPDGPPGGCRDQKEVEADVFASCFLMPEKVIRRAFKQRYLCECFEVNEASAFALLSKGVRELRRKYPQRRDLARTRAGGEGSLQITG